MNKDKIAHKALVHKYVRKIAAIICGLLIGIGWTMLAWRDFGPPNVQPVKLGLVWAFGWIYILLNTWGLYKDPKKIEYPAPSKIPESPIPTADQTD